MGVAMLVIPIASHLYTALKEMAEQKRMVFMAGLPGVGKSLMLQQLALIAHDVGRKVHLMQWDVARKAFETDAMLAKYPEIDGVTQPCIRKAVGVWSREAVTEWNTLYSDPEHLLIGEVPLIGNRFLELAQVGEDSAEPILRSEKSLFVIPVPSWEVREVIENSRSETIENPQHENEKKDAPPNVLRELWYEVNGVAREIGLTKSNREAPYNPYIYGGVYQAILRNRHAETLLIDQVLNPKGSVYDMGIVQQYLHAHPAQATKIISQIEADYEPDTLAAEVDNWARIVTDAFEESDDGLSLTLPLPEQMTAVLDKAEEIEGEILDALNAVRTLRLDAGAEETMPVLDSALAVLNQDKPEITMANVAKFDIYDRHFNVHRTADEPALAYLAGLLTAYKHVLENLADPHELSVVELPLIRIAVETTINLMMGENKKL